MTRFQYNKKILDRLDLYITKYPDIRFGQALVNLNILEEDAKDLGKGNFEIITKSPYNEESEVTYNRVSNVHEL